MSEEKKADVITCKAMVMWENGADLVEETIQVGPPRKGEVRVKILGSGVCHTDWSEPRNYPSGATPKGSDKKGFPVILGHEGGGIVESIGEGVTSLAVGDHVIPLYIPECRDCVFCNSGKSNLCGKIRDTQGQGYMPDGTSRFSVVKDGKTIEILHFMGTSTFSEYTVCAEISLAKVSKEAPLEKVCLLGCGITTGYGAVLNTMKVEKGSTASVWGLGGVGLAVIMGCKEAGCSKIIGVDINPDKAKLAEEFGMTHFINAKELKENETAADKVVELCGGYAGAGVDYSFECIGNVNTMRQAFESVHKGWGQSCVIGVGPPGQEISTRPFQVVIGKAWRGTAFGGTKGRTQLPEYVESYMAGKAPFVDPFVTFTMPSTDVNKAFHMMHEGKALRTVVIFAHEGDEEVAAHRAAHSKK